MLIVLRSVWPAQRFSISRNSCSTLKICCISANHKCQRPSQWTREDGAVSEVPKYLPATPIHTVLTRTMGRIHASLPCEAGGTRPPYNAILAHWF